MARNRRFPAEVRERAIRLVRDAATAVVLTLLGLSAANIYQKYALYGLYSKTAEARLMLSDIIDRQRAFAETHGRFVDVEPDGQDLPLRPFKVDWKGGICDPACGAGVTERCLTFHCLGYAPDGPTHFRYACTSTATEDVTQVICGASGDLDADGVPGLFFRAASIPPAPLRIPLPLEPLGVDRAHCDVEDLPLDETVDCGRRASFFTLRRRGA